jgi:hypothetical protein
MGVKKVGADSHAAIMKQRVTISIYKYDDVPDVPPGTHGRSLFSDLHALPQPGYTLFEAITRKALT